MSPAGSPRPRLVADVQPQVAVEDRRVVAQGLLQDPDVLGGGPLLRAEHRRGALRSH
jgi:hypothetical protein